MRLRFEKSLIQPGATESVDVVFLDVPSFKGRQAYPVDGIEYEHFSMTMFFVGNLNQWPTAPTPERARPILDVLVALRRDLNGVPVATMDNCPRTVTIAFGVRNNSDRALPFALDISDE